MRSTAAETREATRAGAEQAKQSAQEGWDATKQRASEAAKEEERSRMSGGGTSPTGRAL